MARKNKSINIVYHSVYENTIDSGLVDNNSKLP